MPTKQANPAAKKAIPRAPRKPSQALKMALADLEKVERDEKAAVNMSYWLSGRSGDENAIVNARISEQGKSTTATCMVCFAGAVMLKRLHMHPFARQESTPFDVPIPSWQRVLLALNYLREGDTEEAGQYLTGCGAIPEHYIVPYDEDPAEFRVGICRMIEAYQKKGL